jgi:hypothetical protein
MLGEIAQGFEARKALIDAAGRRWMSSKRVRDAAERALAAMSQRAAARDPRGASVPPPKEPS